MKILVDEINHLQTKNALPMPDLSTIVQKSIEVGTDKLKMNVNKILGEIIDLLSSVPTESKDYKINEIKFSLSFDASGEVSLISLAKGSLTGHTGIEFTLIKNTK